MALDRRRFVRASVVGAVTLAGCVGDGDDGDGNDTDGGNTTDDGNATDGGDRPPGATTAQQDYPGYAWSRLEDAEPVETDRIAMRDSAFEPLVATVPVAASITVANDDGYPHTFTVPKAGIDQRIAGGGQTSVRFDEPGTYDYVCRLHGPAMLGRVIVEE